jgi:hypothetical protein
LERQIEKRESADFESQLLFKGNVANNVTSVINNLIKWGAIIIIAYYAKESIGCLAGTETRGIFNLDFKILTDLKANNYFYYIVLMLSGLFGTSGTVYGILQRKSKRRAIEHFSKRKEELEKIIDSGRHSSRLMHDGTTRPEDI